MTNRLAHLNRTRKEAEAVLEYYGWSDDYETSRIAFDVRADAIKAIAAYDNGRGTVAARFDRFWSYGAEPAQKAA